MEKKTVNNMKRLKISCILILVIAVAMAALAAWQYTENRRLRARIAELEAQSSTVAPESGFSPDAPAAEFVGGVISASEAAGAYALIEPYYALAGMDEADVEDAKRALLDSMVQEELMQIKAREYGVYELDDAARAELEARVKAEYEEKLEYYSAFRFDESKTEAQVREETIAYLEENGYAYDSMLAAAEAELWRSRLYEQVTKDVEISDEQLRSFYDEQLESAEMIYSANYAEYESDCMAGRRVLWNPEGVRSMQMLVIPFTAAQEVTYMDIQAGLAAGRADRLEELDALYAQLMPEAQGVLARVDGGEDFEALLREYETSIPAVPVSEKSTLFDRELVEAAMALENTGDVSGILRCDSGLCILRYAGDVTPGPAPFEEVAEELRANHIEELRQSSFNSAVMQWMQDAQIQYHTDSF